MKFHFEPDLEYQLAAIESVADLFRGQEINRTEFTVTRRPSAERTGQFGLDLGTFLGAQGELGLVESELGIGNRLNLLDDEILANVNAVQLRNGLVPTVELTSGDFTVEMETGTGKTYVYLRTIFELNKRYGFTKFAIVVPSVAIKEGVYKTLQITETHFKSLYSGRPFEYFLYDSTKLGQVRNFATSPHIQIMVVTVGAINKKDVNNLYKDSEKTGGERPIDLIRATRPILIVDEPQSVDGGLEGRGRDALAGMNPLCTLRYSATHADKHHMIYRLDAVDAYERLLVKQIEVASLQVEGGHNKPFVRLISTSNVRNAVTAKVEIDIQRGSKVVRQIAAVQDGDDLEQLTRRGMYANVRIGEIIKRGDQQAMEVRFAGGEQWLSPGEAIGDVDGDAVKREMIRRTIKEHLDKELRLQPQGIKVLSLFFVDSVEHYRSYDARGNVVKGKYALMFEEEYRRLIKHPKYQTLFNEIDLMADVEEVHNGYFSIDKTGAWRDTAEGNQAGRDNAERAYNLIMRDKEKLLSFETKLKFIFSHSALREGWDNPNVFQICALREIGTDRERRQTIGRGLRLCVNQNGERVRGFDVNTLTVVATESYEDFAENLQREIEADTGIRFGVVEPHQFAAVPVLQDNGSKISLGAKQSDVIFRHLKSEGYIDSKGKVLDKLRNDLKNDAVHLPAEFDEQKAEITAILRKLAGRLDIKNADERILVKTRRAVLEGEAFRALWDRIKHKTTYRVEFDNDKLIVDCIRALEAAPRVARSRVQVRKADLAIGRGGVSSTETAAGEYVALQEHDIDLPDILTELQDRTHLTRRTLARVLAGSGRLDDFLKNPQQFTDIAAEAINRTKRLALVDGIRYQPIDGSIYAQELFESEELTGYLKDAVKAEKSVHDHVVFDSGGVEKRFVEELERSEVVKVYAKLPRWFTIPTPLGTYNPDWALLVEADGRERLYFVAETKGSLFRDDLRDKERAKAECGRAHFAAISAGENPAKFRLATKLDDLLAEP